MVVLRSTYGSEADAQAAARRLIERRVAACAHVASTWTTYRWDGKVVEDTEWMLEARTPPDAVDGCWGALLDGHPYANPLVEVVATTQVPARYAQWAVRATSRD